MCSCYVSFRIALLQCNFICKISLLIGGEKRGRLAKCYRESKSLFIYLSYHLGSEIMVKARGMFLEKKYRRVAGITSHICGSKAEGLDMKGSDTDIMILIGNAYENNGENVSEDTYPGYVLMECLKHGRFAGAIPSNKLKDVIYTNMPNDKSLFEMCFHGPSIVYSASGLDTDFVHVLKCESWPEIARE